MFNNLNLSMYESKELVCSGSDKESGPESFGTRSTPHDAVTPRFSNTEESPSSVHADKTISVHSVVVSNGLGPTEGEDARVQSAIYCQLTRLCPQPFAVNKHGVFSWRPRNIHEHVVCFDRHAAGRKTHPCRRTFTSFTRQKTLSQYRKSNPNPLAQRNPHFLHFSRDT